MLSYFKLLFLGVSLQFFANVLFAQTNNYPANGKVGLGTYTPLAKLHVAASPDTILARFTQSNIAATAAYLEIGSGTSSTAYFMPRVVGRSNHPKPVGLGLVGEVADVVQGTGDESLGAIMFDGRSNTGSRLVNANVLVVNSYGNNLLSVKADGSVAIGVSDTKGYLLAVGGSMIAEKIKVKVKTAWPDYVFAADYPLLPLNELGKFIAQHHHLPDIAPAAQMEKEGLDVGAHQTKLLQKIEELTLYLLELDKKVATQELLIAEQAKQLQALRK